MEEYVRSAITSGLKEIVFLEHMEAGVDYFESTWLTEEDFDTYFRVGTHLREKYNRKIKISLGVEVGYSPSHKNELLDRLSRRKWDRIGVSYHFMAHPEGGYHVNLLSRKQENIEAIKKVGCELILEHYFSTLKEAIEVLPGTVLCHLDAALRNQPKVTIDERYLDQIKEVLRAVKQKQMSLEINTSGFNNRGMPFPAPFILQEAIKLDIPFLPGSDAHHPKDVGRDFDNLTDFPFTKTTDIRS
jgi:histidinol-phosphatase (PHP family)